VPAETSSINESKPKASSATEAASKADRTDTPASALIQAMLNSDSVLARLTNRGRELPAGSSTSSVGVCELMQTR
jgi:hypothetical protein